MALHPAGAGAVEAVEVLALRERAPGPDPPGPPGMAREVRHRPTGRGWPLLGGEVGPAGDVVGFEVERRANRRAATWPARRKSACSWYTPPSTTAALRWRNSRSVRVATSRPTARLWPAGGQLDQSPHIGGPGGEVLGEVPVALGVDVVGADLGQLAVEDPSSGPPWRRAEVRIQVEQQTGPHRHRQPPFGRRAMGPGDELGEDLVVPGEHVDQVVLGQAVPGGGEVAEGPATRRGPWSTSSQRRAKRFSRMRLGMSGPSGGGSSTTSTGRLLEGEPQIERASCCRTSSNLIALVRLQRAARVRARRPEGLRPRAASSGG